MAAGISLIGVLFGILGSIAIETFRLNSPHLSFRMFRIPFREYWAILFAGGVIVFIFAALLRYRQPPNTPRQI